MKKLRFKVSDSQVYEFKLPSLNRGKLLNFVYTFGLWSLIIMLLVAPLVWQLWGSSEYAVQFLTVILLQLALFAVGVSLVGWNFLVDPPGFVQVLIFSLLVVSAYLFVPLPQTVPAGYVGANTFGVSFIEYLGGLYVMAFVGLFYSIQVFVTNKSKFSNLASGFILSFVIIVLTTVLDTQIAAELSSVVLVGSLVLLAYLLYGKGKWLILATLPGLVFGFAVFMQNNLNLWTLLVVLLTLVVMVLVWLRAKNWQMTSPIGQLKSSMKKYVDTKASLVEVVQESSFPLLLLILVAWFALVIGWAISNAAAISPAVQDIVKLFTGVFDSADSTTKLLLGNGATTAAKSSTLATVIAYQGLVGLLAYVVLIGSSIYLMFKALALDFAKSNKDGLWVFILMPVLVAVPLISIVQLITFPMALIWWVAFSLIVVRLHYTDRVEALEVVKKFKVWKFSIEQRLPWVQLAVVVLLAAFLIYFLPLLRNQLL